MASNNKNYRSKGISLKLVGLILSVFAVIVSATLITSLWLISYENRVVTKANENYIALKDASSSVQAASDDLTNNVRLFVANADKQYMINYFKEVNVDKRRETALNTIKELSGNTSKSEEIQSNIQSAVNESMDLMNLEFYAMKLICVEYNISCTEYPEVSAVNIDSVPPEDRKSEALDAVLGSTYIAKKDTISFYINSALVNIDAMMHQNGVDAASNLQRLILLQTGVIVVNILFVATVIIFFYFYVVRPLNRIAVEVKNDKPLDVHATRELNYVVDAYNEVRSQNEKVKERLVYEAEHDKLTGLYNRTGYVSLYRRMKLNQTVYILLDADSFKDINDEFGHEVGDKVLIRIAATLEKYFKEDNSYAFRLGGDEFSVLIESYKELDKEEIRNRCIKINKELSASIEKMPGITLSIGIAHGGDEDTTDTLFKKADVALYKAKHQGKAGVEVY